MVILIIVAAIVGFVVGLTFYIEYHSTYYELPGLFRIEQRLLDVGFSYVWAKSGSVWAVYRISQRLQNEANYEAQLKQADYDYAYKQGKKEALKHEANNA